jgi:hypothetical protein
MQSDSKTAQRPPGSLDPVVSRLESELAEANSKIQHLLNHCQDGECSVCAEIVCKHHEPLHFHHDGCPVCECSPSAEQIGKAWLANSSLERWFPITAEELERLREEVRVLKSANS